MPESALDFVYKVYTAIELRPPTPNEVTPFVHRIPIPPLVNHVLSITNQPTLTLLPPILMLERTAIVSLPTHPVELLVAVVLRHPLRRRTSAKDLDVSMHALGTTASTLACDRAWGDLAIV